MRAAVFEGPGEIVVTDIPDPEVAPDGIVIAVDACGICGSDLKTYATGRFVRRGQVLGHEFVGRIIEVGDAVDDLVVGEVVTALPYVPCGSCDRCHEGRTSLCDLALRRSIANGMPGGFAELLHLPGARRDHTVFPLPDATPALAGALIEPLAVGLHAVGLAQCGPDDVVVVLGLGTIGLAVVYALRAAGVRRVVATDVAAPRLTAAAGAGARVVDGTRDDLTAVVAELTGPGAYGAPAACDVVIDCAGSAGLLARAVPLLRSGGTVVLAALYDEPVPIDATAIVRRGIRVLGTFGYDDDFARAVALVGAGAVDPDDVITHRFGLADIGEAFAVQADPNQSVKVMIEPGSDR